MLIRNPNYSFKGLTIDPEQLSPRTLRFFKKHRSDITYCANGDIIISNADSISENDVKSFILEKENEYRISIDTLRKDASIKFDNKPLNGDILNFAIQGNFNNKCFGLLITNLHCDESGVMQIGIFNKDTNVCETLRTLTKPNGYDFMIIQLKQTPNECLIQVAVVATPPQYNSDQHPKLNSMLFGLDNSIYSTCNINCNTNTRWLELNEPRKMHTSSL